MSATAAATVVTTRASGRRPPRRPRPPANEPVVYATRSLFWLNARRALRAMAYTTVAIVGLGGIPAAMALLDDVGVFRGIFAL